MYLCLYMNTFPSDVGLNYAYVAHKENKCMHTCTSSPQQSRVARFHMTPDLDISMWKSVHLACPQAVRQAGRLSAPISRAAQLWFSSWMWIQGGKEERGKVGEDEPDVGNMQGFALCQPQSSRAHRGLPTGPQDVRMTRRHEVKQVNGGPHLTGRLRHLPVGPCWLLQRRSFIITPFEATIKCVCVV